MLLSGVLPTKFGSHKAFLSSMTFDPINALCFGQAFFLPNLVAIEHLKAIWPLVNPGWPLHDLWPQQCITLWSGAPPKFGSPRAFLRQLDRWITFDLWWGHFEKLLSNFGGPPSTSMPGFSSLRWNTTKRIAGYIPIHTYIQTLLFVERKHRRQTSAVHN